MCAQSKDHVKTYREGTNVQAKKRGLKGTNSVNTLNLDFQPPEISVASATPVCSILLWGPA